jgi:hypothetical protein
MGKQEKYSQASKADTKLCRLRKHINAIGFGGREQQVNVKSARARLLRLEKKVRDGGR